MGRGQIRSFIVPISRVAPPPIARIDFQRASIRVHDGKGLKDRVVPLPRYLVEPLKGQLRGSRNIYFPLLTAPQIRKKVNFNTGVWLTLSPVLQPYPFMPITRVCDAVK